MRDDRAVSGIKGHRCACPGRVLDLLSARPLYYERVNFPRTHGAQGLFRPGEIVDHVERGDQVVAAGVVDGGDIARGELRVRQA